MGENRNQNLPFRRSAGPWWMPSSMDQTEFGGYLTMKKSITILLILTLLMPAASLSKAGPTTLSEPYGVLPLHFEPNQGQTDHSVKFLARGDGYSLFLTDTEAV